MSRKIITTEETEEDKKIEGTLRPQYLKDYIGQEKIKSTLKVFIDAAKSRGEALDHVLFYGPPGLGKTTLCGIIANEMGVNLKVTSGPAIEKPGEMAAILNNLQEGDVLFVDEIHRRWRKTCIRRWKILPSISCLERIHPPARSDWIFRNLHLWEQQREWDF